MKNNKKYNSERRYCRFNISRGWESKIIKLRIICKSTSKRIRLRLISRCFLTTQVTRKNCWRKKSSIIVFNSSARISTHSTIKVRILPSKKKKKIFLFYISYKKTLITYSDYRPFIIVIRFYSLHNFIIGNTQIRWRRRKKKTLTRVITGRTRKIYDCRTTIQQQSTRR